MTKSKRASSNKYNYAVNITIQDPWDFTFILFYLKFNYYNNKLIHKIYFLFLTYSLVENG
jgi:hypothetical protein